MTDARVNELTILMVHDHGARDALSRALEYAHKFESVSFRERDVWLSVAQKIQEDGSAEQKKDAATDVS